MLFAFWPASSLLDSDTGGLVVEPGVLLLEPSTSSVSGTVFGSSVPLGLWPCKKEDG